MNQKHITLWIVAILVTSLIQLPLSIAGTSLVGVVYDDVTTQMCKGMFPNVGGVEVCGANVDAKDKLKDENGQVTECCCDSSSDYKINEDKTSCEKKESKATSSGLSQESKSCASEWDNSVECPKVFNEKDVLGSVKSKGKDIKCCCLDAEIIRDEAGKAKSCGPKPELIEINDVEVWIFPGSSFGEFIMYGTEEGEGWPRYPATSGVKTGKKNYLETFTGFQTRKFFTAKEIAEVAGVDEDVLPENLMLGTSEEVRWWSEQNINCIFLVAAAHIGVDALIVAGMRGLGKEASNYAADKALEAAGRTAADWNSKYAAELGESALKETAKETLEQTIFDSSDEIAERALKLATEESLDKVTKETAPRIMEEAAKQIINEKSLGFSDDAIEAAAKKLAGEAAGNWVESPARHLADDVVKQALKRASAEAAEESVEKITGEALERFGTKVTKESAEKLAREAAERAIKEAAQKMGKELSEEAIENLAGKMTKETMEYVGKKGWRKAAGKVGSRLARKAGAKAAGWGVKAIPIIGWAIAAVDVGVTAANAGIHYDKVISEMQIEVNNVHHNDECRILVGKERGETYELPKITVNNRGIQPICGADVTYTGGGSDVGYVFGSGTGSRQIDVEFILAKGGCTDCEFQPSLNYMKYKCKSCKVTQRCKDGLTSFSVSRPSEKGVAVKGVAYG